MDQSINTNNAKLIKRYLSLRGSNITDRTRQAFEWDLNVFLRFLQDKPLENVTHIDIDDFIEYCREDRNNSDAALLRKYNTLNKFYNTMIDKEYIDMVNPLKKVEKIKVRKKLRGHVTLEEYKQIIDYLEAKKDYRGLALFSLLFSSGMRLSEVYGLNIDDFDMDNKMVRVLGKGEKERDCLFSEEAKNYLLQYIRSRKDDLEYLFISRENNRWGRSTIQQFIKKTAKEAGIEKNIHTHLLRHGCAMTLLENDLPLDQIQEVLGHSSISTTQIYAQTSMKRVKANVDSIYDKLL